jgi:hypothetical protein
LLVVFKRIRFFNDEKARRRHNHGVRMAKRIAFMRKAANFLLVAFLITPTASLFFLHAAESSEVSQPLPPDLSAPTTHPAAPEQVRFPILRPSELRESAEGKSPAVVIAPLHNPNAPETVRFPLPADFQVGATITEESKSRAEEAGFKAQGNEPEAVRYVLSPNDLAAQRAADAELLGRAYGVNDQPAERTKKLEELAARHAELKDIFTHLLATERKLAGVPEPPQPASPLNPHFPAKPTPTTPAEERALGGVFGKILDAVTRRPLVALVRVTDADGLVEERLPGRGFLCLGQFSVPTLSGPVEVEISAGSFRSRFQRRLNVKPGKPEDLGVVLLGQTPGADFENHGRHPTTFNFRIRARKGERTLWTVEPPGPQDLALTALSAGVRIVGLEVPSDEAMKDRDEYVIRAFSEQLGLERGLTFVPVLHGPRHALFGSVWVINPERWRDVQTRQTREDVPLTDALHFLRHPHAAIVRGPLRGEPLETDLSDAFVAGGPKRACLPTELPLSLLTDESQVVLAHDGSPETESVWFAMLNEGFRAVIVADEDGSLESGGIPQGRTFLLFDGPATPEKAADAVERGAATVSFGPALFASIVERNLRPGDFVPADGRELHFSISALSESLPGSYLAHLEIIRNGKIIHTEKFQPGQGRVDDFQFAVRENQAAWYVLRLTQKRQRWEDNRQIETNAGAAWTNPFFFVAATAAPTGFSWQSAPKPCRVRGTLLDAEGKPLEGHVVVIEPRQKTVRHRTSPEGAFDVQVSAAGALVFSAPDHEPLPWRFWSDERVRRELRAFGELGVGAFLARLADGGTYRRLRSLTEETFIRPKLQPCKSQ